MVVPKQRSTSWSISNISIITYAVSKSDGQNHNIVERLVYSIAALTNTQEEAFRVKLHLECHTMLQQTVATGGWRPQDMVAGGLRLRCGDCFCFSKENYSCESIGCSFVVRDTLSHLDRRLI